MREPDDFSALSSEHACCTHGCVQKLCVSCTRESAKEFLASEAFHATITIFDLQCVVRAVLLNSISSLEASPALKRWSIISRPWLPVASNGVPPCPFLTKLNLIDDYLLCPCVTSPLLEDSELQSQPQSIKETPQPLPSNFIRFTLLLLLPLQHSMSPLLFLPLCPLLFDPTNAPASTTIHP